MRNVAAAAKTACLLLSFSLLTWTVSLETPAETGGGLDIRIHPAGGKLIPPAELLLVNPAGMKSGKDPRDGRVFRDIPESFYERESIADDETGAPGPETAILDISNPVNGVYKLEVIGIEDAEYSLEIRGYDLDLGFSDAKFLKIMIKKGQSHHYRIEYSSAKGSRIEVTPIR